MAKSVRAAATITRTSSLDTRALHETETVQSFERVWVSIVTTQSAPPAWVVSVSAAVAVWMVVDRRLWRRTRHLITTAHEGSHGVVALLTGRRLSGIRLHSDSSGVALSKGRSSGVGMVLMLAAGYVGPGLIGLGAAALLAADYAVAVLWLLVVLLALLLVQIRNWFGLWSVLVTGSMVLTVSWFAPEQAQSGFAYLVTGFLLVGAPRPVVELHSSRRRGGALNSDADQLSRLTGVAAIIWVGIFLVVTVGSLGIGASWLLGGLLAG